jgi:hypothetical protein
MTVTRSSKSMREISLLNVKREKEQPLAFIFRLLSRFF